MRKTNTSVKICAVLAAFLLLCSLFSAVSAGVTKNLLCDNAGVLSDTDALEIREGLDELSARLGFDVVIVTTDSLANRSVVAFADDYFDYNGYGYGASRDGVLLLISMGTREWYISTSGYGITAFTDYGIDRIGDDLSGDLSAGRYAAAFRVFMADCEDYVLAARAGNPIDRPGFGERSFPWVGAVIVSLLIGFVIALIVVHVMKKKLKSVYKHTTAGDYLIRDSFVLEDRRDYFLFRTIRKVPRPKSSSSSGGGSSVHRSSSGRSHGGGGGHF